MKQNCMAYTPWFKEPPLWSFGDDEHLSLRLHKEIEEFYEKSKPTQQDKEKRAQALERVKLTIKSLWPSCEVRVFGSFATGLYLPEASDMDIVILDSSRNGNGGVHGRLHALGAALRSAGMAEHVEIIGRARVPIVKFREVRSGLAFDVRFDSQQELLAANLITSAVTLYPALAPLYVVLKSFLHTNDLNEVYHTGGLASYTLFVMLYTFLQLHPRGRQVGGMSGLGSLLAGFFHFYSISLNVRDYGISCRSDREHFFLKAQRGFLDAWKPYLLAVEDPLTPSNDLDGLTCNYGDWLQFVGLPEEVQRKRLSHLRGDRLWPLMHRF